MVNAAQEKAAFCGMVCGWGVWLVSHIQQINAVLQGILLLVTLVVTLITGRYYYKRTPK